MRKLVRALYVILMYAVLLAVGTEASDGPQHTAIDSCSKEPMSSIQDIDIDSLLDNLMCYFSPEEKTVPMWTESIETEYYPCQASSNTELHEYNPNQYPEYTELVSYAEQADPLPSFYSTFYETGADYPPAYCIPNEPVQEYTVFESLSNCEQQPTGTKRPIQPEEKNAVRKKQKSANENTESSLEKGRTNNDDYLCAGKLKKIKKCIGVWENSRLKDRHKEGLHICYKPAILVKEIDKSKYKEIDHENRVKVEEHFKRCKSVYNAMPAQNEFWFAIASQKTCMHTKLADCRAMHTYPSEYKFVEEMNDYYPGLSGDVVRYMDKHGPIITNRYNPKKKWTEALGDICVRALIEPEYRIDTKTVVYGCGGKYRPQGIAVQMILSLSEVNKDLRTINAEFIYNTFKEKPDLKHFAVVRALHTIANKHKSSNKPELYSEYAILCNVLGDILQQTCVPPESIVVQLYTEMYKSLVYFYEKAEVCEEILDIEKRRKKKRKEKEYYLLAGKCIIKQQRYLKCTTAVYLNRLVCEYEHVITEEANKWSIPSDIQKHYHIHYVDNTKQKYARVCMPMCSDRHIHTISQTVEYLKRLYSIEEEGVICPYRRNISGDWKHIEEEEKDKTVNEFADCDIVFYYIEEGIRENYFTFVKFESYKKPSGRIVSIPLFFSPLMRSAVSMGPFKEANAIKHTVVREMQHMNRKPDVYAYKRKYRTTQYFHIYHYYSNLYIRRDNADAPTIDCYIMDSKSNIANGTAIIEWYAKIHNSVDEYTHCMLSNELRKDREKYNALIKAAKSQEYTPNSALYGFGLRNSLEKTGRLALQDSGCSTNHSIDQKDITHSQLSITSMHAILNSLETTDTQSEIDKLNKNPKQANAMLKKAGMPEELEKKKDYTYSMKSQKTHNLNEIQPQDQLCIEEDPRETPSLPCIFLVFQCSNAKTKSCLGIHNEIIDSFTRMYHS